jgi:hypothetical protein
MREVRVLPPLADQMIQNRAVEPERQYANEAELPPQCAQGKGRARARRRSLVLHNWVHVSQQENRPGETCRISEITRVRNAKSGLQRLGCKVTGSAPWPITPFPQESSRFVYSQGLRADLPPHPSTDNSGLLMNCHVGRTLGARFKS